MVFIKDAKKEFLDQIINKVTSLKVTGHFWLENK